MQLTLIVSSYSQTQTVSVSFSFTDWGGSPINNSHNSNASYLISFKVIEKRKGLKIEVWEGEIM